MNNIDLFNLAAAEVLGICYKNFPIQVEIKSLDIARTLRAATEQDGSAEELTARAPSREFEIAKGTILWLIKADYLYSSGQIGNDFPGLRLTPKGLEVLNLVPESIEQSTPIGEQLRQGLAGLGTTLAAECIKLALTAGATWY